MVKDSSTRRGFLRTVGVGIAASVLPASLRAASTAKKRPNVLYMMSDDHAAHTKGNRRILEQVNNTN